MLFLAQAGVDGAAGERPSLPAQPCFAARDGPLQLPFCFVIVEKIEPAVQGHLVDDVRQDVMVELVFNMGIGTLSTFVNTLRAVEAHNWPMASAGLLASKWAGQVGARATRLAAMMKTGARP